MTSADSSIGTSSTSPTDIVEYDIEDKPPANEAVPLGIQHLLAMFLSTAALPIVIARAIGLGAADTTFILQMALLVAGVATIVQAYPVGPIGARLPIVMGTSAIFVAPLIGYFIDDVRGLFPPLVTGIVVMLVGLTLIPVAMDYSAGGPGAATYGNLENIGLAALVFLIAIGLNQFFDGFLKMVSVLVAVVVGYLTAIPLGLLDLSGVASAGWISVPMPLAYGVAFEPSAILVVAFAYIITAIETIGDVSGTTESVDRDPEGRELKGGLVADGVMSAIAGVFNAFPNTSFSQNVGLISFTGVASRYVVALCGGMLVVLGFVPKVAALIAAMPNPVLGGAAIVLFGMIFSVGIRIVTRGVVLSQRNLTIIAASITLGLGVEMRPDVLSSLPSEAQLLAGSGLIAGGVTAVVLNVVLPADDTVEASDAHETTVSVDGVRE